jgi:hypothetical protein
MTSTTGKLMSAPVEEALQFDSMGLDNLPDFFW